MERAAALRRLQKRFGKHFAYRENKGFRPADERATAFDRARAIREDIDRLSGEMKRLRDELLSDPVYQNLLARWKELKHEQDRCFSVSRVRRFDVGTMVNLGGLGGAFHVAASGDSWEEIFRELDKRDSAAKERKAAS